MGDINSAVTFMIQIANDDTHGYDQTHRNGPDYDCSSLVATALNQAGFCVSVNSWTGNLKEQLLKENFKECVGPWKAGDIHLNEKNHVCMSINQTEIVEASINEKGGITGGQPGDQSGHEIHIRGYYDGGWDCHLRYVGNTSTGSVSDLMNVAIRVRNGEYGNYPERKTKLEAEGYDYEEVQKLVNQLVEGSVTEEPLAPVTEIAKRVIQGEFGVYPDRATLIEQAGYDYKTVQDEVNRLLGV